MPWMGCTVNVNCYIVNILDMMGWANILIKFQWTKWELILGELEHWDTHSLGIINVVEGLSGILETAASSQDYLLVAHWSHTLVLVYTYSNSILGDLCLKCT